MMLSHLILSLLILPVSIRSSTANKTAEFERTLSFFKDFLRKLGHSRLVAYVSWSKAECTSFSELLSGMSILHAIVKNNVPVSQFIKRNERIVIVLEMKFKDSLTMLQDPKNYFLFREPFIWILLSDPDANSSLHNVFMPVNSIVYKVNNTKSSRIVVDALYKFDKTSAKFLTNRIAEWSLENGFRYFRKLISTTNRTNFMGTPIRTSYVIFDNDSLNHLSDYRFIDSDKLSKINYRLIDSLKDLLNTSRVNIWTNSWGNKNLTTGEYSAGIFKDLLSNRADITGTTAFISKDRLDSFTYLVPTTYEEIKFVFRAPSLSYTKNVYTTSFSPMFYLSCLSILVLGGFLLYFLELVEYQCGAIPNRMTLMDVVATQICSITQNSVIRTPELPATRIAVFFNMIFCMLVYTAFSAYIVILLQKTTEEIKDVRSLYDSKMPIGVQNTPYNKYYFSTPNLLTNEHYRKLFYENRLGGSQSNFISPEKGMKNVQGGFYAFQVEQATAHYFIKTTFNENEKCSVKSIPTIFVGFQPYLVIPKNSSYYNHFQVGFRRLFETGLHQREYVRFFTKEHKCQGAQRNYDSVRLMDCYFPFLIFTFGCTLSIFVLVTEKIIKRIGKKGLMQEVCRTKDGYRKRITQPLDFIN